MIVLFNRPDTKNDIRHTANGYENFSNNGHGLRKGARFRRKFERYPLRQSCQLLGISAAHDDKVRRRQIQRCGDRSRRNVPDLAMRFCGELRGMIDGPCEGVSQKDRCPRGPGIPARPRDTAPIVALEPGPDLNGARENSEREGPENHPLYIVFACDFEDFAAAAVEERPWILDDIDRTFPNKAGGDVIGKI